MKIEKIRLADTMLKRTCGLIGSKPLEKNEAMLISRCRSVHTMFMKYPIDAIFLDEKMNIVAIENNIQPWRITNFYSGACYVMEILTQEHGLKAGNQLTWLRAYLR